MFSFFNMKLKKSVEKYSKVLRNDINLIIQTRYFGKSYYSYVENINNDEVIFRCPIDEYEIIRFKKGSNLAVNMISYSGIYSTKLLITESITKEDIIYYKGKIVQPIKKQQRRKDYRLPIEIEFKYTILPRENREYTGRTVDMSISGMLMRSDYEMKGNEKINIKINIDGKLYRIKGKILRTKMNYKDNSYNYNVQFEGLRERNKNEIARFIFDNKNMNNDKIFLEK